MDAAERAARDRRDEELVAAVLEKGDATAFGSLVEIHQSAVRGWLRRLCDDVDEADDLAQETFVRAWQRLGAWRGDSALRTWLFTIARNLAYEAHRRRGREARALERFGHESAASTTPDPAVHDLEGLLAALGEAERECVVLALGWGMTMKEIGGVTGLPDGTVKSHVHRARRRLASLYGTTDDEAASSTAAMRIQA